MAGAEIFVNRSTFRTVTDEFGGFTLAAVPAGLHEIVAWKKGFVLYRAPMRILAGRAYSLNLQFTSTERKPRGKSTPESEYAFTQTLLGSRGLLLLNSESTVNVEQSGDQFRVLSGPIIVEYPNAGYRITAYFNPHVFQRISDAAVCFQEYQGSNVNQNMAIERTRQEIYQGSVRHWLTSIISGQTQEEGFTHLAKAGTSEPPPSAVASPTAGYYRIRLDSSLVVRYKDSTSVISPVSAVDANTNGILINVKSLDVSGFMDKSGLDNELPLDYRPIKDIEATYAEALRYFYEKIYVHTDKPYYYPGEPLWMKAYVNYYNYGWRDSLSNVLHVELINARKEIMVEKTLRIEKGFSHGDFIVPDSIPPDTYYLRAYTNLQRNFGDSVIFTKPLRVLELTDRIDPSFQPAPAPTSGLTVATTKQSHRVRDLITLELTLDESLKRSGANVSVSVTDASQVIAIPQNETIFNKFPIDVAEIPRISELKLRIEQGVSFFGQFLNNEGEPEKARLSFIQWKTGDVLNVETAEDGMFWQTGLYFADSALFSYKSDKAKGRTYGSVNILPRVVPAVIAPATPSLPIVKAGSVQRIFSEYEVPKDSKLLEEIEVVGKRADESEFERAKRRPHGRADYVITSKNLRVSSGNLLLALVGKVPGLAVNPTLGTVYFSRALGGSFVQGASPMVTLNDSPMAGEAGAILQSIDINTIESIEFTKRLSAGYGSQGSNGVIAVYTKMGVSDTETDPNFQTIRLPGYSVTRAFQAPNYEVSKVDTPADYRSTLYWNPDLSISSTEGKVVTSFYASDLAGTYRVVVEGIAGNGQPLRAELLITIADKP